MSLESAVVSGECFGSLGVGGLGSALGLGLGDARRVLGSAMSIGAGVGRNRGSYSAFLWLLMILNVGYRALVGLSPEVDGRAHFFLIHGMYEFWRLLAIPADFCLVLLKDRPP